MHHCKSCNTVGKEQQLMSDKANLISSSVALALGRPGARYHVGYPVLARSVFGMLVIMSRLIGDLKSINLLTKCRYGQFFFVWIRAVVATIW